MKSKLQTLIAAAFMTIVVSMQAQVPATLGAAIVTSGFDAWTGSTPNGWMVPPATTIPAGQVTKTVTTNTAYAVYGTDACNLVNTTTSYTGAVMAGTGVSVTAGMGYQISYYARGKGTITSGVTDGSSTTANYVSANGQSVSGAVWHHYYQTVIAPTTTTNAQFFLKVKSTTSYSTTSNGGITITGIDVDSFKVQPYTPVANASLYSIQYTTSANTNSPFFGQFINQTGGIVSGIVLSSSGPDAYYIQTSNSNQWAGALVFDFTNSPNVALGDSVTFGCAVDEYYNMTELIQITNFQKISSGNPVPAPIQLITQAVNQEMYESMLVQVQGAIVPTYSANYGQGTALDQPSAGSPVTVDFRAGFYPPNGNSTSSAGGYAPQTTASFTNTPLHQYCITGNVNYEFSQYNIVPRDSGDIMINCTTAAGIKNNSNTFSANVYPNPMTNELNIKLPFTAQKVNVSFIDVLGKETMSTSASGSEIISIKENNLAPGVYMVRIVADGKTQMVKIIKQ